jgi:hypothetical protein
MAVSSDRTLLCGYDSYWEIFIYRLKVHTYGVFVRMVKFVDLNGESYNTIVKFITEQIKMLPYTGKEGLYTKKNQKKTMGDLDQNRIQEINWE